MNSKKKVIQMKQIQKKNGLEKFPPKKFRLANNREMIPFAYKTLKPIKLSLQTNLLIKQML